MLGLLLVVIGFILIFIFQQTTTGFICLIVSMIIMAFTTSRSDLDDHIMRTQGSAKEQAVYNQLKRNNKNMRK